MAISIKEKGNNIKVNCGFFTPVEAPTGGGGSTLEVIEKSQFNPAIEIDEETITIILDKSYENKCVRFDFNEFILGKGGKPRIAFDFTAITKNFKMFFSYGIDTFETFGKMINFKTQTLLNIRENLFEHYIDINYYDIKINEMCEIEYYVKEQEEATDVVYGFLIEIDELGITKITPCVNVFN